MFAWQPIAPDHFVSLGMVCTSQDEQPPVQSIRCVPSKWVIPAKKAPLKVWDDTGAGGGRPGSIWIINTMNMIAVVPGHEPPKENQYDLSSNRFFIDSKHIPLDAQDDKASNEEKKATK